jgi:hypothetical protein
MAKGNGGVRIANRNTKSLPFRASVSDFRIPNSELSWSSAFPLPPVAFSAHAIGRVTMNPAPSETASSTWISPPCSSRILATMARPSPVPFFLVEK